MKLKSFILLHLIPTVRASSVNIRHHPRSLSLSAGSFHTCKNPFSFPISALVVFSLPRLSLVQLHDDRWSAKGRGVGCQPVSNLGVQEDPLRFALLIVSQNYGAQPLSWRCQWAESGDIFLFQIRRRLTDGLCPLRLRGSHLCAMAF